MIPIPSGFYQFFKTYGHSSLREESMIEQIKAYAKSYDRQIQARLLAGLCDVYLQSEDEESSTIDPETRHKELQAWIEEAIAAYEGHPPSWMLEIARKIKQKLSEYAS